MVRGMISKEGSNSICSEESKLMWMREKMVRIFIQMELVAWRDECEWLLILHHCVVNNYPKEYCPLMPQSIPPDYARNLIDR